MQQLTTATSPTVVFLTIISLFHQLALIETVDQIHGISKSEIIINSVRVIIN